ncbi:hypothetical protein BU17DRAFT_69020 [Hysterangium stoloniferum]|nr:hypothetical protein BU17DRAFT_69020 [Hysterangium stoloniferum]
MILNAYTSRAGDYGAEAPQGFPVSPRGEGSMLHESVHEPLIAGTPFFNANEQSDESTSLISPQSWNGHDRDLWQCLWGAIPEPWTAGQPHEIAHRVSWGESERIDSCILRETVTKQRAAVVKYKCDCAGCDAAGFSSKENASAHVRRMHFRQLDQKAFKCLRPECARHPEFASLSAARRHVKDKAKARCPDCQSLHRSLHFHPKLLRCPDGVINAQSAMSMCHPWYYFPYFPTPINPTGGYRAADDVVFMSLSIRNMDDTSKLRKVAPKQSLQLHLAAWRRCDAEPTTAYRALGVGQLYD